MDSAAGVTYKRQRLASPLAATTTTTTIEDLKDDEMVEIWVRLPLECVFRCKCVSKRWRDFISGSCFITSYRRRRQNLPLRDNLVYFQVYLNSSTSSDFYSHVPMPDEFYPTDVDITNDQYPISDPSGKFFDFSFDFFPFELAQRFYSFGIVRSSHGLLLCKGDFTRPTSHEVVVFNGEVVSRSSYPHPRSEYYVCNPLMKQWLRIPMFDYSRDFKVSYVGFACYALDPHLPHKVEFVVLEIEKKSNKQDEFFYTRVFSSQIGSWNIYRVACPQGLSWSLREMTGMYDSDYNTDLYYCGTIVVYQGKFHWNGGSCLVAYDPLNEPHKCSLIPTPKELAYNGSRIDLGQGHIRMSTYTLKNSCAIPKGTYSVYELTDYDSGKWDLKFSVKKPLLNMLISFSSESNKEIIFVKWYCYSVRRKYVLYNMRSQSILGDLHIPEHPTKPYRLYSVTLL